MTAALGLYLGTALFLLLYHFYSALRVLSMAVSNGCRRFLQPLRSELVKSRLKVISPNQVKVVVMDDQDFSTVKYCSGFCLLLLLTNVTLDPRTIILDLE